MEENEPGIGETGGTEIRQSCTGESRVRNAGKAFEK